MSSAPSPAASPINLIAFSIVASASRITGAAWTAATRTVRKVVISVPSLPTQSYGLESFVLLEERAPLDHAAVSEGPDIGPLVLEREPRGRALSPRAKDRDD